MTGSSPSFFISYRYDDTSEAAGWLRDVIARRLGQQTVFHDLTAIAPGRNFREALDRALASCDMVLALIGPHWETIAGADGRPRIEREDDILRQEIRTALQRRIPIVPILVRRPERHLKRETLPPDLRALADLESFQIHAGRWEEDVDRLLRKLGITDALRAGEAATPDRSQARFISATAEWKRTPSPDPRPRRFVVYIDNASDAPITVHDVVVGDLRITDWGLVRPGEASDYELDEADFDPSGDKPSVRVRFVDSFAQEWTLGDGRLQPAPSPPTKSPRRR